MGASRTQISLAEARALLGVASDATPAEIRKAYLDAAKRCHPDVGGSPEAFLRVMAAYRQLEEVASDPAAEPIAPTRPAPEPGVLEISPLQAWAGGHLDRRMRDGRIARLRLPVGLRQGEVLEIEGETLTVTIRSQDGMTVRGDDLWITAHVPQRLLEDGGRIPVVTPIGRRILWVTKKAGERRLLRAPDLGLPARGQRPQGALFVRLAPRAGPLDSAARALLRRFAAAWAA